MPYPATTVANEFVERAVNSGVPITPLKLQKLVYFAHGWCLALTERPLISDSVQAWKFGPVIPSIYRDFRDYGNNLITSPAVPELEHVGGLRFSRPPASLEGFPDTEERTSAYGIIEKVLEKYGKYTGVKLSNATHMAGSPWQQVYTEGARNQVISNDLIKAYFKELASAPQS